MSRGVFIVSAVLLLAASFFVHLYDLENRPFHHDESSNGWFVERILKEGKYEYAPHHFHGPTMFKLGALSSHAFGLSNYSIRFVTAIAGVLLTLTPLLLRAYFGFVPTLFAMAFLAFAPANLFYSRYGIHEILLVTFFTTSALLIYRVVCKPFLDSRWNHLAAGLSGLAMASAAASKETFVIYGAAIFLGLSLSLLLRRQNPFSKENAAMLGLWILGFIVGLFVWFKPLEIWSFVRSYIFYHQLGTTKTGHEKDWPYFYKLLWTNETPLLLAGIGGGIVALWRRSSFGLFAFGWAFMSLLIHALIPYKTPWIVVNFTVPLCFLAAEWARGMGAKYRYPAWGILTVFLALSSWKAYAFSFRDFIEEKNSYCYVHTYPEAVILEKKIKEIAAKNPQSQIAIVTPEIWPFPFTLRDMPQIIYHSQVPPELNYAAIVAKGNQLPEVRPLLKRDYAEKMYRLRPGVDLYFFVERGLIEP